MGLLHSTQHMAADVWQYWVRRGRAAEKWDRGEDKWEWKQKEKQMTKVKKDSPMAKIEAEREKDDMGKKGGVI